MFDAAADTPAVDPLSGTHNPPPTGFGPNGQEPR
jgi:hypothetical protein